MRYNNYQSMVRSVNGEPFVAFSDGNKGNNHPTNAEGIVHGSCAEYGISSSNITILEMASHQRILAIDRKNIRTLTKNGNGKQNTPTLECKKACVRRYGF